MRYNLMILVSLFVFMFVPTAKAAESGEVERVVSLMYSSPNVIARKLYHANGVQVVFVAGGLRYTLYHTGGKGDLNLLSVWVRKNGTTGQRGVLTFTDHSLDGTVNLGINGKEGSDSARQYFNLEEEKGVEFRHYWQSLYDKAIKDALRALTLRK